MKKNKVVLGIAAALLTAVLLMGCAGKGDTSVGKKYESVYSAVGDYVIASEKGSAYLFKDDKKIGGAYKSIDEIEIIGEGGFFAYDEYFLGNKGWGSKPDLLKNDGTSVSLSDADYIDGVYVYREDPSNLFSKSYTVAFRGYDRLDGNQILIGKDGKSIARGEKAEFVGSLLRLRTENAQEGKTRYTFVNKNGEVVVSATVNSDEEYEKIQAIYDADNKTFVKIVGDDDKASLYGENGKIADNIQNIDGLVYWDADGKAYLAGDSSSVALGENTVGYLGYFDGSHYVADKKTDSEKVFVRKVGGDGDWESLAVDYIIGFDGRILIARDENKTVIAVGTKTENILKLEENEEIDYNNSGEGYVVIRNTTGDYVSGKSRKLITSYMSDIRFGGLPFDAINRYGDLYTVGDHKYFPDKIKYIRGNSGVFDAEDNVSIEKRAAVMLSIGKTALGDGDEISKKITDNMVDVNVIKVVDGDSGNISYTLAFGLADKDGDYIYAENVVSGEADFSFVGDKLYIKTNSSVKCAKFEARDGIYGVDITWSDVSADKGTEFITDSLGNGYILQKTGDKTAVYDSDYNLLLKPLFAVEKIENNVAVVSAGEFKGVVKLDGKSKLMKKIEYDSVDLLPTGDFILGKAGSTFVLCNAKGKNIEKGIVSGLEGARGTKITASSLISDLTGGELSVKFVVTATDGKDMVVTSKISEKDIDSSILNVMFNYMDSMM